MESQWIMCDYVRDKMIIISLEVLEDLFLSYVF